MTDPSLSASQLNTRLVPKLLAGLNPYQQNKIIRTNGNIRSELIRLLWNLKHVADKSTQGGGMLLYVKDSSGKLFGLLVRQQVAMYHYLVSTNSTGLARLVHQSFYCQNLINLHIRRTINEP